MHHITARGGQEPVDFHRALLQSPGWSTTINATSIWRETLAIATNVSGKVITCGSALAALDSATLMKINAEIIFNSPNGSFTFGPTVDGGYVPDLPGVLLLDGKFNDEVELMLGHNSNEGASFVSPAINDTDAFTAAVAEILQDVPINTITFILTELYPPPSQTDLYSDEYSRLVLLLSEVTFVCNTRYLSTAFNNATFNYRFQVPPSIHAQDVPWTFYRGNTTDLSPALAETMQLYFTQFAEAGHPNHASLPQWPRYGDNGKIVTFGLNGVKTAIDDAKNKRCAYWQTGAYRGGSLRREFDG